MVASTGGCSPRYASPGHGVTRGVSLGEPSLGCGAKRAPLRGTQRSQNAELLKYLCLFGTVSRRAAPHMSPHLGGSAHPREVREVSDINGAFILLGWVLIRQNRKVLAYAIAPPTHPTY
jgi:hypothetical protein